LVVINLKRLQWEYLKINYTVKKETSHTFSSAISVFIETEIFKMSFWWRTFEEDKTDIEKIFDDFEERKILALNSSLHSNEVKILDAEDVKNGFTIFPSWIDGVIVKNIWKTNKKINLLACFADCGGISFSSKSGDIVGLIHAGHKWVANGIIQNLCDFFNANIKNKEDLEIFIAPMLGNAFEFEKSLFEKNFSSLLKKYAFSWDTYFTSIDDEKGFLNLRLLIQDIFLKRGLKKEQIVFDNRVTNDPKNNLPSHRLFTQYHHIQKKLILWNKLSPREEKFSRSENFSFYKDKRRILVGVGKN
jgi:copper oxidase (laccase) domain-containing protein